MRRDLAVALVGILAAFGLGALVMAAQGYDPAAVYRALYDYSLGGSQPGKALGNTLFRAIPLVLTGLSATLAFRAGAVNLGQPGQFLWGALFAVVGGLYLPLPAPLLPLALIALSLLGGALWAALAGFLRTRFGMNEFIVTLMLNSIADKVTLWVISYPLQDQSASTPMTPPIAAAARLPDLGTVNAGVIVLAVAFVICWIVASRSRLGYEWRLTGQNSLFARLGGVPEVANYSRVMALSGALAGLAGGLIIMGESNRFIRGLGANYAWDGIMVAVIANNGLWGTLAYGLFFAALQTGALGMELITALPSEFIQVLQALTVLLVVAGRGGLNDALAAWWARRRLRRVHGPRDGAVQEQTADA